MRWISAAVVGGGFGMDEEPAYFGGVQFEGAFEGGDDGVDLRHGKVVGERAVAVDLDAVANTSDEDLVDVENLREGGGGTAEAELKLAIAFEGYRSLDGGGFALDMGEDGGDLGNLATHLGLELSD